MTAETRWIDRDEALARLGVKAQTLYAYVSRGRIAARSDPGHPRRSLYAAADIARLLDGAAPFQPAEARAQALRGEAEVRSAVGMIAGGRLFYRGLDAVQLSQHATLETVARRLWDVREADPFSGLKPRVDALAGGSLRGRIFATLARRADEDAGVPARSGEALKLKAAGVLNEVVDTAAGLGPRLYLHQRLGRGWRVLERDVHLIRRALALTAAADLGPPELATRAAIDGGASLAGAALTGLTALAGSAEARAVAAASEWVVAARREPAGATRRRWAETGAIPGFGDPAWPHGDPRAEALLAAADLPPDLAAVVAEGRDATQKAPTLALALAVVARRLDLPREGASDLLIVGRLTGFLAHALDQRIDGSPIRARMRYVGPEPGAN